MIVICSVCETQIRRSAESMGIVTMEVCPKCTPTYTVVARSSGGNFAVHRLGDGNYVILGPDGANERGVDSNRFMEFVRMMAEVKLG